MPFFTFRCPSCGDFSLWYKSSKGNNLEAECPSCSGASKRVFTPPNVYRMDHKLKQTIERGMEPRVVKKEDMPARSNKRKKRISRPWQAGH